MIWGQAYHFSDQGPYHGDRTHRAIIPCIVMDVDFTVCTGAQTSTDEHVVVGKLGLVEYASALIVRKILPGDGETEQIVTVVLDKVLHLTEAIGTYTHA